MSEANKARSRRVFEEITTEGKLDAIDEVFAADFVGSFGRGTEGVKQTVTMFRTAFPDTRVTVEEQVAEGDKVVSRVTFRGTHEGPLFGNLPASGKPVTITGIAIDRHAGGKIAERYLLLDQLSLLRQIGVIPS
ncbi:MAG: ester cyclase [Chloroflexi bacterium]|nr:ester cyclase [Chloroflexota bacterium]